jgi:cysteine desulfurase
MDNHATTAVDPRVLEAMLPFFGEKFGNPASHTHRFGWEAEAAVEAARKQVAQITSASAQEIIFTSGATESDNLAIKGVARKYREKGNHIVTLPTEHKAVLDTCKHLEKDGFRVTCVPVQSDGLVDIEELKKALGPSTILVSIMAANNEIGVLQPLAEIGRLCHERGILFHTDAAQAVGKVPMDVQAMNIDLLSISAHKIYGPKGVGALYVRRNDPRVELAPLLDGGGHESGWRSGTLNVPGIVGLGKACEISQREMSAEAERLRTLRDRLKDGILTKLDEVYVNGSLEHRLPNNLSLSFAKLDFEPLMMSLSDVALSSGSACTSATPDHSYVLKALGVRADLARSSIRFGLGRFNTQEEVDYVVTRVVESASRLRELSARERPERQGGSGGKTQCRGEPKES